MFEILRYFLNDLIINNGEILVGIIGIWIGCYIAIYMHKLSKQKSFEERFKRRELIQKQIDDLLYEIGNGRGSKVELINVERYDKDEYSGTNDKNRKGYKYLGGKLKGYDFDGVEFICRGISAYPMNENLYQAKKLSPEHEEVTLMETGIVPYEWIEAIDKKGDGTTNRVQFYVYFKSKNKEPFKSHTYYKKDESDLGGYHLVHYKKGILY